MAATNTPQWPSLGLLAKQSGIGKAALRYAALRLGVSPVARVGNSYLYSQADCEQIVRQAKRIAADRGVSW